MTRKKKLETIRTFDKLRKGDKIWVYDAWANKISVVDILYRKKGSLLLSWGPCSGNILWKVPECFQGKTQVENFCTDIELIKPIMAEYTYKHNLEKTF